MPTADIDLPGLIERFGSEDACHAYLERLRWPNGIECPRCGGTTISRIKDRRQFDCNGCRYQFSVRVGTIFHDSKLPLWKWFLAVYLVTQSKKGISSKQLERMLGVSYKTAWYLSHRIRAAMKDDSEFPLLKGIVEVDETLIGGKRRGVGRGSREGKTLVVGAVQRGGSVRLAVISERSRSQLHGFIRKHVDPETEAIFTDDWGAYEGIGDHETLHETINHRRKEWVVGNVHTNTVEGVWSLLKRSVVGAYHKLSVKHLPAYLDELEWRFNNRGNPYMFRDTMRRLIGAEVLRYQKLVA
ncbi:MAG: IS1595 family transposase [Thermoanaerobaculia bacterium]|nr:IS1595 family transposase [Thermoanaerobaculia bacterium]